MLSIEKLQVFYGESHILQGVDLKVEEGEIVCLLGRNGVGKTTLLRSIMGLVRASSGLILFGDTNLCGRPPYRIARLGIGYVPQGREIFPDLTVQENLLLGAALRRDGSPVDWGELFGYFPVLEERLSQKAGTLSGGEQQMLAVARALAGAPRLILLDEPSEGLQPSLVDSLKECITKIHNRERLTILLVEQNLDFALSLGHRYYIMEKGTIVAQGGRQEFQDAELIKRYLAI